MTAAPANHTSRNDRDATAARPPSTGGRVIPAWLVLMLGLAATFFASQNARRSSERADRDRFEAAAGRANEAIKDRLDGTTQALSTLRGIFVGSQRVEREEFRALVSTEQSAGAFSGLSTMGFIRRVPTDRLDEFLAMTRSDGAPEFAITPERSGVDIRMVVEFSEPDNTTSTAPGLDIASIESYRIAALDAMQKNEPRLSPMPSEKGDPAGRFRLLLMPISRPVTGAPEPENRAELFGWVFIPVDVEQLAAEAQRAAGDGVAITIAEQGTPFAGDAREAAEGKHGSVWPLRAGGLAWCMIARPTAEFIGASQAVSWSLAVGGSLVSLVAFVLLGRTERQRMAAVDAFRRAAEDLRLHAEEAARLALVAQCTSNAVVITDSHGTVGWVNDGFVRITGYAREDATGRPAGQLLCCNRSDRSAVATIQNALKNAIACRVEVLNCTRHGVEHWIDLEIQPIRNATGQLTGFIAVESDITAQVDMRNRLRGQAEGLTDMSRMAKVGRWSLDVTTMTLHWCDQVRAIHEVPPEFAPDLESAIGFYAEESREAIREAVERAINLGESFDLELKVVTAKGRTIFVRALGRPVTQGDKLTGVAGAFQDITEQVALRESAMASERQHRLVVECASLGTWDWSIDTGDMSFNDRWFSMLGYAPGELPQHLDAWRSLMHPDDLKKALVATEDHFRQRTELFKCEHRLRHKDGSWRWIFDAGRVYERDAEGNPLRMAGIHLDITNEKLTGSRLEESQHILQSVLNVLPQRVFWKDLEGRYLGANTAFLKDAGVDSVIGKTDDDMPWVGKQAELYRLADRAVIALDMAEMDIIEPQSRSDGSLGWLSTCKVPLHDSEGRVTGVLGTYMDITQSRAAEEALRESEARFRAMADAAPVLVWMSGTDGKCFFFNRSWLEFTGRTLEDAQSADWVQSVHPDDRERCMRIYEDAFSRRESFELEYRMRRYDGEYRWLVDRGVPRLSESREFLGYIGGCMDIQDSRQAQEALAEAEQQIRSLINNIPGVSYRCEGTGPRMMTFISDAVEPLTGYPASDFVRNKSRSFDDILYPEDRTRVHEALATAVHSREPYQLDYRIRRENGEQRWVRERGRGVFDSLGELKCIDGAIFDVTDQRRDAEALQAAKEAAEAASHTKSEFLANMSHEIRTPMTAILGFADLLREDGDASMAPQRRIEAIDTIRRNGEHLLAIINDILDLSKIEAGKLTLSCSTMRPVQMVGELISLLKVRAAGKGLYLKSEFPGRIPETIDTDPVRLRQVLMNLVGNALKFTEVGGVTVVVSSRTTPDDGTRLRFDIIDTGIGMTPEQQSRLFRPFTQADESTTRRFGGTGLGLTISQRLAEMLHGEITVSSEPGKGSTFSFEMSVGHVSDEKLIAPCDSDGPARPEPTKPSQGPRLDGLRILLVEDGPDNQRLISFHLQRAGAAVTIADNGRIGVDLLSNQEKLIVPCPFDLVLMDMQMPVLDGYAAATLLRNMGCRTPIVALTAHAMTGDADACINAGCDDYSTKPIDRQVLLGLCRKWADAGVSAKAA